MKNSNVPKRNTISNEVKIDLDVLGTLMLNRVRGHIDGADIVAKNNCGSRERSVKLLEELAKPTCFSDGISDSSILCLSARAGDGMLALGGPRDQVVTKEYTVARGRSASVRTTSPVCISVNNNAIRG